MTQKVQVTALVQPPRRPEDFEPLIPSSNASNSSSALATGLGFVELKFPWEGSPSLTVPAPVVEFPAALLLSPATSPNNETTHRTLVSSLVERCVAPALRDLLEGRNSTLFVIGASAAVKDVLMIGSPESCGLLPASLKLLLSDDGLLRLRHGESFLAEVSYVAVTANSCFDLVDPANRQAHVVFCDEPLVAAHEGDPVPTVPAAAVRGAATLRGETLDDALQALDIGLDSLAALNERRQATAASSASSSSSSGAMLPSPPLLEHSATVVFSLELDTKDAHAVFQIVTLGDDARLVEWLVKAAVIAEIHGGGDEISAEFAEHAKSLQHNAITILAPLLSNGNCKFSCIVAIGQDKEQLESVVQLSSLSQHLAGIATTPLVNYSNDDDRKGRSDDAPLPAGWEKQTTADGKTYFVDHVNKITTWADPRLHSPPSLSSPPPKHCDDPNREVILGDAGQFVNYRERQRSVNPLSEVAECAIVVVDIDDRARVIVPSKDLPLSDRSNIKDKNSDESDSERGALAQSDLTTLEKEGSSPHPPPASHGGEDVFGEQRDPLMDENIAAASRVANIVLANSNRSIPAAAAVLPKPSSDDDEIESLVNEFHHMFSEAAKCKTKCIRVERELHALKLVHEQTKESLMAKSHECEQLAAQLQQQQRSSSTTSSNAGDGFGGGKSARSPEMIVIKQLRQRLDAAESRVAELESSVANGGQTAPAPSSKPPQQHQNSTVPALHRLVANVSQEVRQLQSALPEKLMDELSLQLLPSVTVPDDDSTLSRTVLNVVRALAKAVAESVAQDSSRRRGESLSSSAEKTKHHDVELADGMDARSEIERVKANYNERFELLTKQMLVKQEEIVRRLHSDYESAIQKEKKRLSHAKSELDSLRAKLHEFEEAEKEEAESAALSYLPHQRDDTESAVRQYSGSSHDLGMSWPDARAKASRGSRRKAKEVEPLSLGASIDRISSADHSPSSADHAMLPWQLKAGGVKGSASPKASAGANARDRSNIFTSPVSARDILHSSLRKSLPSPVHTTSQQQQPSGIREQRFSTASRRPPASLLRIDSPPEIVEQNHLTTFLTSPKRIAELEEGDAIHLRAPRSTSTTTRSHEKNVRSFTPFGAGGGGGVSDDRTSGLRPAWRVSRHASDGPSPSRLTEFQLSSKRPGSPS